MSEHQSIVSKVASLPVVMSVTGMAGSYYHRAKDMNVYSTKIAEYGESTVTTATSYVAPYLEDERVKSVDAFLVSYFDRLVENYPSVQSSLKDILESLKSAVSSVISAMTTRKDKVLKTVVDKYTEEKEYIVQKKDQILHAFDSETLQHASTFDAPFDSMDPGESTKSK
eukprot:CFRG3718T1